MPSWFGGSSRRKSHDRLESKDFEQSDDSYMAITADVSGNPHRTLDTLPFSDGYPQQRLPPIVLTQWTFTEGHIQSAVGLTTTETAVIETIDSSSPFSPKLRKGDTIVSVNGKDTSSTSVIALMEQELTDGKQQFTLVALRKRAGTEQQGIQAEDGAWSGKE